MSAHAEFLAIGQVVGVHGIRGEVKVALLTDFPQRFRPGAGVWVGQPTAAVPVEIESSRPHRGLLLVKFRSVADRDAAELLCQQFVLIPEAQAMPLAEHENYAHDLVGLEVESLDGRILGHLTEILFTRANDVYVVAGPDGEILLPALRSVIVQVDLPARKMRVELPAGLLKPADDAGDG